MNEQKRLQDELEQKKTEIEAKEAEVETTRGELLLSFDGEADSTAHLERTEVKSKEDLERRKATRKLYHLAVFVYSLGSSCLHPPPVPETRLDSAPKQDVKIAIGDRYAT